jgi:hypothetical protein
MASAPCFDDAGFTKGSNAFERKICDNGKGK